MLKYFDKMDIMQQTQLLEELNQIADVMDAQFSIAGFSFGLDGIIGLVPIAGDVIGGLISAAIVYKVHKAGLPEQVIRKMIYNILADMLIGSIPVVGDLFDFFFKVNKKNIKLVERYFAKVKRQTL